MIMNSKKTRDDRGKSAGKKFCRKMTKALANSFMLVSLGKMIIYISMQSWIIQGQHPGSS
jgi:hypothetical protein